MIHRTTLVRLIEGGGGITVRRAAIAIAFVTLAVTIVSGILMRFADPTDYDSIWDGLWWAVQTVTTVGYGDLTPTTSAGRLIATFVMLTGIGFIAVATAAITASFIETARRRHAEEAKEDPLDDPDEIHFQEIIDRLDRIEKRLGSLPNS